MDAAQVDFGPTADQAQLAVGNTGREPLVFETRAGDSWISFVGGEGTLDPGAKSIVSVVLDRSRAPEGHSRQRDPRPVQWRFGRGARPGGGGPGAGGVERRGDPAVSRRSSLPGRDAGQVRAAIVEESGVGAVELHWVRPGTAEQVSPMSGETGSRYLGVLGPFDTPGDVRWWVSASDIRNNRSASPPQALRVGSC